MLPSITADRRPAPNYHWLRGACQLGRNLLAKKHDIKDSGVDSNPATGAAVETLRCHSTQTSLCHGGGEVAHHKPYSIAGLLSFVKRLFWNSA